MIGFLMLQPLSTDLYLASLPSLGSVFGAPSSKVQLTLSMFVIAFGGAQLIIGPLSDRFGHRPVVIAGLALYVLASLLCALSPTIELLIAARFVQALGCCSAIIIARAIVRDAYAPADSGRVVARASTWLSVAPLTGPILGSWLQVTFGWQAAFVALSLLSSLVLLAVILRLPETNEHKNPHATEWVELVRQFQAGARLARILDLCPARRAVVRFDLRVHIGLVAGPDPHSAGAHFHVRLLLRLRRVRLHERHHPVPPPAPQIRPGHHAAHRHHDVARSKRPVPDRRRLRRRPLVAGGRRDVPDDAGARRQFPGLAGLWSRPSPSRAPAAGLMGALYMSVAFAVGTAVGASFNGSLYPLAIIACTLGACIFASSRLLGEHTAKVAS
ncbi:MFS transporter [Massilia sp. H-1]|nr:MFS transporter [Massilia sp. H-1]